MNDVTVKIIIGIVSAVLVGALGVYKEEVKNFFISSKKYKYLLGKWQCNWELTSDGKTISDNVDIKSINGKILKGTGHTKDVGPWTFKGDISESTITLIYKSGEGYDHSGVIILKLDVYNKNEMDGVWSQHTRGNLVSGTTKWIKL
jgi:hypothetical protein